jgi:hypothetical protein
MTKRIKILQGGLLLLSFTASTIGLANTPTPPCTCGSNISIYLEVYTTGKRRRPGPEPSWCAEAGSTLLTKAYGDTPRVPSGFLRGTGTDVDKAAGVYWITHPTSPVTVGSYRTSFSLSTAATLDDARVALQASFSNITPNEAYPHLAATSIVQETTQRLYFEFDLPSNIPKKTVLFRIWKSEFFSPAAGWVISDTTEKAFQITVGKVPESVGADDIGLLLEQLWWESDGLKALDISRIRNNTPQEVNADMPVISSDGSHLFRDMWSLRVDRRTGDAVRKIKHEVMCMGREVVL